MYSGYLERQALDVEAFKRDEDLRLDPALDYAAVGGLSNEVREKLAAARPVTLGQASRIEGVTAGALTALLAHVKREQQETCMSLSARHAVHHRARRSRIPRSRARGSARRARRWKARCSPTRIGHAHRREAQRVSAAAPAR